jgi:hypothetical protein
MAPGEISWQQPIVPIFTALKWEREVKKKAGPLMDFMRRVAASPWLRQLTHALCSLALVREFKFEVQF